MSTGEFFYSACADIFHRTRRLPLILTFHHATNTNTCTHNCNTTRPPVTWTPKLEVRPQNMFSFAICAAEAGAGLHCVTFYCCCIVLHSLPTVSTVQDEEFLGDYLHLLPFSLLQFRRIFVFWTHVSFVFRVVRLLRWHRSRRAL